MKKLAVLLSTLLVAGAAFAAQTAEKKATPTKPAMKTHVVETEVVSADAVAHTLTVKGEKENATYKVDASATGRLKELKAGEKIKVTCRDNEKGEHQAITHIEVLKAPAKM